MRGEPATQTVRTATAPLLVLAMLNRVERPRLLISLQLFLLQRDPDCLAARKTPGRLRRSRARERVSVGWRRRSSSAASAVDHRPHESLTSDPKPRRRWPTADLAKRLLHNCTPRRRSTSSRRRSPQCEVCSPYRAVRMNTRAKFGWRGQTSVRRLNIARGRSLNGR